MTRRIIVAILTVAFTTTCGCNLFPASPAPQSPRLELVKTTLDVSVAMPAGGPVPSTVRTSVGTVEISNGVAPQTPLFEGGPQFAMVSDAAGNAQLLGFVGPGAEQINTHTTAEVLLFFNLNAPLLTGAGQVRVLEQLRTHAAVQALADAIAAALVADPLAVANNAESIKTALKAARTQIMQPTTAKSCVNAARILINPGDSQSGITISQLGLNSINIRNDFRRRAHYFVEAKSFIPEGGGAPEISDYQYDEGSISPTAGATSVFGMINDLIGGTHAYAGVDSDEIDLPIIPNTAESTTYKVTVVGIGARAGVEETLNSVQAQKKRELILKSFVIDFFVPAFVDLIIPIDAKKIDQALTFDHASVLVGGFISAVGNAAPLAVDKVMSGDLKGGLLDLYSNVLADGSVRFVVMEAMFHVLDGMGLIGPTIERADRFNDYVEGILKPIDAFDSILIGFDSIVQVAQIAQSERASSWTIISDRSKVKLSPPLANLDSTGSQVFRATIPDASDDNTVLAYHWNCTAQHGGIRDNFHSSADFDSSEPMVTYFPKIPLSPGEDTITVEAFEVRGQNRISLGKASAKVTVTELVPKIAPDRISLVKDESQTFKVSVDGALANGGALTYRWFSTSKFGEITQPPPQLETTISSATFKATGTPPGEDTLAVEVFSTKDGVKKSLGIARAQIKIEQRKTIYLGSFNVEVQFAQPGFTGTPGYSFVTAYAKVPKMEGATSYSCRIYNFYDGAYWGHGTTFDDYIVRNREDRGNEYWIGLTGGQTRDENIGESVAAAASRFVGIIVEVTVTY